MIKNLKLFLFLVVLILPFNVRAYGVENYYIDATIEENGDLLVQEYFNMTGEYNGHEAQIYYSNDDLYEFDPSMTSYGGSSIHNGSGVEILEVRSVPINSNFSFDNIGGKLFTKTTSASKGDYGVYVENYEIGGKSLMIYNPSSYNNAFYLKYRIKNIAVRHNDVAEIYWNIIGDSYRDSVGNLKVYLHIPENTNVRTWAHGPLSGNVSIIDQETILVTISNLSSYRAVDVRATFNLDVINKSTKMTGVNALDKIILYETDKAEQANYERQNEEKLKIQRAEEALSEFEVDVTRYNYEDALEYINLLDDSDIKVEYLNRLEKTKLELDRIEEEKARYELKYAKEYLSYSYYEDAKESIEVLDNQQVKAELLQELLIVENQLREIEIKLEKTNYIFGIIFIIVITGIGYMIYRKFVKDPKTVFNHKYFREIPNDYSPETVSYLFHKKIIDNSMSATLMDLIHRKIIVTEKLSPDNYKLILNEENAIVTNVESKLLDLIFNGSTTIETKDMKTKSITNYSGFISRWNSYKRAAEIHAKQHSFYEDDIKLKTSLLFSDSKISREGLITILIFICCFIPGLLLILLLIFGLYFLYKFVRYIVDFIRSLFRAVVNGESIVLQDSKTLYLMGLFTCFIISFYKFASILVFQHFYKSSWILYLLSMLLSVCLIPFVFYKKRRTQKGAEDYKKWKALEKFLKDFGRFSDKEVQEVILWEKYLVYATLFGCADKVINVMKVKIPDIPNDYLDSYYDLYIMNQYITRTMRSSYALAQSAYASAHSSSGGSGGSGGFSSGSGGGGGFSSGGGGGGGGRGGGRF